MLLLCDKEEISLTGLRALCGGTQDENGEQSGALGVQISMPRLFSLVSLAPFPDRASLGS